MKKSGVSSKLQPSLLKQEVEHDEIYEDTWEAKENELLPYVKNDVLSTAFCYARYIMGMEGLTNFSFENSLTLPSVASKNSKSLKNENYEPISIYTDSIMRSFVRKSVKGGRCNAFSQHFKSDISDEVFIFLSKVLNVNCNI